MAQTESQLNRTMSNATTQSLDLSHLPLSRISANLRRMKKRHWCFTSFVEHFEVKLDAKFVRYAIWQQEETPITHKLHWQGYIEFFDSIRMGQVKQAIGECHLEFRKGSRTEAREYCRKAATAVANTQHEFGTWREDVSRKRNLNEMLLTDMTLDTLIETEPATYVRCYRGLERLYQYRAAKKAKKFRTVEVVVYIGKTGTGKTRRAAEEPDHFFQPCTEKLWFDGYTGQKCLILDDFYGNIRYGLLLRILDGHECQLPVKGAFVWAQWTKVVITSNQEVTDWYTRGLTPALARRITTITHM